MSSDSCRIAQVRGLRGRLFVNNARCIKYKNSFSSYSLIYHIFFISPARVYAAFTNCYVSTTNYCMSRVSVCVKCSNRGSFERKCRRPYYVSCSVRYYCRVEALWYHMSVRQPVVFHSARGQAFEGGVFEGIHYCREALLGGFEDFFRGFPLVVDCVDVGAVGQQDSHHIRWARVELWVEIYKSIIYLFANYV